MAKSASVTDFDRRTLVAGSLAWAAGGAFAPAVFATLAPATDVVARANALLDVLSPDQRKAATFTWDGETWRGWNYFGASGYMKPGLRLEQMSAAQKDAAWALWRSVLSEDGLAKARTVMLLQDILVEQGNGVGQRSSERFSLQIHGTPALTGTFGLRLEGHHLSLSVTVRDGSIASVTPSSFSSNPNRVTTGRHKGLVTLGPEEAIARRLFADLAPALQRRVRAGDRALGNILSYAGRERANVAKVGVPLADFVEAQRELAWQLIDTYTSAHLAEPLKAAQQARVRSGDPDAVHFAWYGGNIEGKPLAYRLIGPTFVIEMATVDDAALHLHTIYHDLGTTLGRTA
jgi:hypothetical protein